MSSKRPNVSPGLLDVFPWYRSSAPVHLAAAKSRTEVVEVLALAGADVEAYDVNNRTAFDIAAIGGHMDTLKVHHSFLAPVCFY
jgi:ankyrin repeat protein